MGDGERRSSDGLPLAGVRVVDHTDGEGTETTARLLADLGADTVRVEPLEGARSRAGEFYDQVHNVNKRSVTIDLGAGRDRERFLRLVASADILVTSFRPGELPRGLDAEDLADRFPELVVVSVTPYGRSGPYRDWAATEATHLALGGVLSRSGLSGRDPLLPPGTIATESVAAQATWSALVAYHHRLTSGVGDLVDCSVFEGTVQGVDPGYGIGGTASGGVPGWNGPRGRPDARHLYPVFACRDGWVRLCILSGRQWHGMFRWLGEPEELADPRLHVLSERFRATHLIFPAIERLLAGLTRAEAMSAGDEFGVPTAGVASPTEVLQNPQFRARRVFAEVELPSGARASMPDGMVEIDGRRAGLRTPAPALGAHTADVLDALPALAAPESVRPVVAPARPLTGLRVLDLGVIVVGAETGRLFADLGADVIKVENGAYPDGGRQSSSGAVLSAGFAYGHRSKRSLGLNLRSPRGRELFLDLARRSDVVLSNFKPGTMDSLGLGVAALLEVNPRLVVAESSAFGPTGPWSRRMGYGPLVRAAAGLSTLWRYPGESEADRTSFSDTTTIYPDHVGARIGAAAVLAKLIQRIRTDTGGSVAVAQAEVILGHLGSRLARESVEPGGLVAGATRDGVLDGLHPCAGDDEWCVVSLRSDEDWVRLADVLGVPAHEPRFADHDGRVRHRAALDALVTAWTTQRGPRECMETMQGAGVPAAMMQRLAELRLDPHLIARGFFHTLSHPLVGSDIPCEGGPALFRHVADPDPTPAPLQAEHTEEILHEVLGLSRERIADLVADGTVEILAPDDRLPAAVDPTALHPTATAPA
ncbi:CoA transferase [Pseudonocardia halophobica]|nr:CoA transferase [Pseudonocardia halophobica]